MTTDARALVAAWDAATDDEVRAVFLARGVPADIAWTDFFDAAEALLSPASVDAALGLIGRTTARELATGTALSAAASDELRALGLTDDAGRPLAAVTAAAAGRAVAPDAPEQQPPVDSAAAAERALVTVSSIADLVLTSYATPVARIGTGAVGSIERRRLSDVGIVSSSDDVDVVLSIAREAGLLTAADREWLVTPSAADWLAAATLDRWSTLKSAFLAALPAELIRDGALVDGSTWVDAYPWRASWAAESATLLRGAVLLGLVDATTARSTPWARADEPDIEALAAHLPHEVDRVFLQNDLSVIAPGPLAPGLDLRLRAMAVRESQAQASTYRFTAESVQNSLSRGESEESILEFLGALSLTGIPQPLRYLVHESAARHGTISVAAEEGLSRSRVRVATPALRQTLLVDQTLRPLGFTIDGDDLVSRVARDTVALALADAHYPVAVLSASGEFEPITRGRVASDADAAPVDHTALIVRLRSADLADMEAAWLHRELEQAVRSRTILDVTVSLPDGERTFTLEAAGLGGGRLRGRDKAADVERTLPLSHILHVRAH